MSTTTATVETRNRLINVPRDLLSEVPEQARWSPRNLEEHAAILATWENIDLRNENADTRNMHLRTLCNAARERLIIWLDGYSAHQRSAIDLLSSVVSEAEKSSNPTACGNGASSEPGVSGSSKSPMSAAHG